MFFRLYVCLSVCLFCLHRWFCLFFLFIFFSIIFPVPFPSRRTWNIKKIDEIEVVRWPKKEKKRRKKEEKNKKKEGKKGATSFPLFLISLLFPVFLTEIPKADSRPRLLFPLPPLPLLPLLLPLPPSPPLAILLFPWIFFLLPTGGCGGEGPPHGATVEKGDTIIHCGTEQPRIQTEVLGHSLHRSLVHLHHSLVCFFRPAHFARALRCAHLFARSLTPLLERKWIIWWLFILWFFLFWIIVQWKETPQSGKSVVITERKRQRKGGSSDAMHGKRDAGKTFGAMR